MNWGLVLFIAAVWIAFGYFSPLDPTDLSRWQRSGLYYYKDHGTGCEYIAAADGWFGKPKLIPRIIPGEKPCGQ